MDSISGQRRLVRSIGLALTLLVVASAIGQTGAVETAPSAQARRTRGPISLDGRLDERDWAAVPALDRFLEYYPTSLAPPSEQTEVRFLYDQRYLYIGVRAFLRNAAELRKPFVRRDKVGASHDYVQVYLDPLGTRRSAYLFRINARGVKTDGVRDEARLTETLDPDFEWDAATQIDEKGWSGELRIPLSTLRMERSGRQIWAVIVTRGVPRAQNTQMATAPFPHDASCFLCYAGELSLPDIERGVENLLISLSSSAIRTGIKRPALAAKDLDTQLSLDLKWLPYAGAALDLTVRPDFSQVEADAPQLTANARFALSLPEKRPFFREASDLVATPIPAVYTRAIVEPEIGARFTHRSARTNATAFLARDIGGGGIIEPGLLGSSIGFPSGRSDIAFAHAKQARGTGDLGLMAIGKRNSDGSFNTVGGVDIGWGNSANRLTGQALASWTRNPDRPDLIAGWTGQNLSGEGILAQWDHTASMVWSLSYERYGRDFRSWLGFVPRVGYQRISADLQRPFYLTDSAINDVTPYFNIMRLSAISRAGHESYAATGVVISLPRNTSIDLGFHAAETVLTREGEERTVSHVVWKTSTNPAPWLPLVQINGAFGETVDFVTGRIVPGRNLSLTVRARPFDRLELEARHTVDDVGHGAHDAPHLTETATEMLATYFFAANFYALADYQHYAAVRRGVGAQRFASDLASLQFVWQHSRQWQIYWGARQRIAGDTLIGPKSRSSEIYIKITRAFAWGI